MARAPLALLRSPSGDWKTVQTEQSARGFIADTVVFVREPTTYERTSVEGCLVGSKRVFTLNLMVDA